MMARTDARKAFGNLEVTIDYDAERDETRIYTEVTGPRVIERVAHALYLIDDGRMGTSLVLTVSGDHR